MIQLTRVSKKYSENQVLNSISLSFSDNRTHVLLGSSGSGKSTLLRIINGIISPDLGDVWIGDIRLTPKSQPQLVQSMGFVTQEGGLFPHLSAKRNILLK